MSRTPETFNQEKIQNDKVVFLGNEISHKHNGERWFLTQKDVEKARKFYEEEKVFPLDDHQMFQKGVESILSRAEKFIKQKRLHKILLENNLDTPERVINNLHRLKELFEKSDYKPVFPKAAVENIFLFSDWWLKSNIPREIIESKKGKDGKTGIEFRDRIANLKSLDKAPGMGPKIASLFVCLCGFEDVTIIDQHICLFLRDHGYFPWKLPDREEYGGLWLSRYKNLEKIMSSMAKECHLPPAIFQLSLWNKYREKSKNNKN